MNEFNETHIRLLYSLLNHRGYYSRIGSLEVATKKYENKILFGIQEILEYARVYNGKRNLFIGRAYRNKEGVVLNSNVLSYDIDPIREKEVASNDEQHVQAFEAAKTIVQRYQGGYIASSGNGALIVYSADDIQTAIPDVYAKEATLIKEFNEMVGGKYNVKVDSTNYNEAVIKLIGTQSTKGEISKRRISRWLTIPIQPYKVCTNISDRLRQIKIIKSPNEISFDIQKMSSVYSGDRSAADFHLANYLYKSGVRYEDTFAYLRINPLGRRTDEKDQIRLLQKVYGNELGISKEKEYFENLWDPSDGVGGINTGFSILDEAVGGFRRGEVSVISARSGYGKSTFACTSAENLRKQGRRVLYFSTEMHKRYIMHKMVAIGCNIPLKELVERKIEGYKESILSYKSEFTASPIYICDDFQPSLQKVKDEITKYSPDLVIFDHINQASTSWQEVAEFMRGIKLIATETQLPILVLAQLNEPPRNKEGGTMLSIRGDIRGSQEIIYLASLFIFLSNPYENKGDVQPVEFHIAKNRYGVSGGIVTLSLNKVTAKFSDTKENV